MSAKLSRLSSIARNSERLTSTTSAHVIGSPAPAEVGLGEPEVAGVVPGAVDGVVVVGGFGASRAAT